MTLPGSSVTHPPANAACGGGVGAGTIYSLVQSRSARADLDGNEDGDAWNRVPATLRCASLGQSSNSHIEQDLTVRVDHPTLVVLRQPHSATASQRDRLTVRLPLTLAGSASAAVITTIAGSAAGIAGSSGNGGPATSALLSSPISVAFSPQGDLAISDGVRRESTIV